MILSLREARPGDVPELTRLAHAAKAHWGYPESWIRAWSRELTLQSEDLAENQVFVIIDEAAKILGFAALRSDGSRCHLEHFWVDPSAMGGGVGRLLFTEAVARARRSGALSLEIDSDPHAAGFYRRLGAFDCGEIAAAMEGVERVRPQLRVLLSEEPDDECDHRLKGSEAP